MRQALGSERSPSTLGCGAESSTEEASMKSVACSIVLLSLAVLALLRAAPVRADPREGNRDAPLFIIDTDMDNDDAAAIAYLCQKHLLGQMGALVIDPAGDPMRVGIAANQQRFEATFFRILNARTRPR
jgi:hypothetical protein